MGSIEDDFSLAGSSIRGDEHSWDSDADDTSDQGEEENIVKEDPVIVAKKENHQVAVWRTLVFLFLLAAAAVVAALNHVVLSTTTEQNNEEAVSCWSRNERDSHLTKCHARCDPRHLNIYCPFAVYSRSRKDRGELAVSGPIHL